MSVFSVQKRLCDPRFEEKNKEPRTSILIFRAPLPLPREQRERFEPANSNHFTDQNQIKNAHDSIGKRWVAFAPVSLEQQAQLEQIEIETNKDGASDE